MRPRITCAGFTLIELLVALTVMAVMAVMSWQGIDAMSRAQAQSREHSQQILRLQTGLLQWTTDLDALAAISGAQTLDWNGRALRLVRSGTTAADGYWVVAWSSRIEDGQTRWLRWQSPSLRNRGELQDAWLQAALWAQNPGEEQRKREVRVTALEQWQIFYYRQNAWTNPLSSVNATATPGGPATADTSVPDGVRLVLTLPAGTASAGTLVRDWIRPAVSASKS